MIETVTIIIMGLVLAWWLFSQWRGNKRARAGRCARCGTRLDTTETRTVRVHGGGGTSTVYRMCVPCAKLTRSGWIYWTVALIVLVLGIAIAIHQGWLPNE